MPLRRPAGGPLSTWRGRVAGALAIMAAAGVLLAVDSLYVEPRRLQRRVRSVPVAGLPPALDGLTILHLSDFHYVPSDAWLRRQLAELATATASQPPDVIAITGDFVEWDDDIPAIAELLGRLHSRYGCFAVLGNHDYGNAYDPRERPRHPRVEHFSDRVLTPLVLLKGRPAKPGGNDTRRIVQALAGAGIRVLRNAAEPVAARGSRLWVAGMDEPHQRRADPAAVFDTVPPNEPLVLLAHSPDVLELALPRAIGLLLAGHTHGGQVRLPFLKPLVTHTRHPLPAYQGLIATRYGPMHISAGMSASVTLRFRCPPEITTLILRSSPAAPPVEAEPRQYAGSVAP